MLRTLKILDCINFSTRFILILTYDINMDIHNLTYESDKQNYYNQVS